MKILNYCAGYDTGGYSIRLKRAFDNWSAHEYRSCIGKPVSYIRYPTDAPHRDHRKLIAWADLIHVSHQPLPTDKPQIVQYHGTKFRNNPDKFLALQQKAGATAVCSTLDLQMIAPDLVTWLPTPYNLDWLYTFARYGARDRPPGPLRVGHAPTSRAVKSTDALIDACKELAPEVELVLIERQPWETCLEMKGTCDVYFDQVKLGYGNNAVEAWGMGIPVIAGAQPATLDVMHNIFGWLPFYQATEDTIVEALTDMLDPEARDWWATIGLAHAKLWHDEQVVVGLLENIYQGKVTSHA